jgi:hypothetical protein
MLLSDDHMKRREGVSDNLRRKSKLGVKIITATSSTWHPI